ncbi:hypothetical protein [Maribacter aquivivus]|uniref:hypothetical protein n=1 Tax=Maribacter aquivivus TaxID=228958 RepID=UPI002493B087|nr:hypothetical protein [Maribacter aquivivus]
MFGNRFLNRLTFTILLLLSILLASCFQSEKEFIEEYRKELKPIEIQGLIIATRKNNKGRFRFLITQNMDTTTIFYTGVLYPSKKFHVGDSIFKPKNQMIFTVKRKDSIFEYEERKY